MDSNASQKTAFNRFERIVSAISQIGGRTATVFLFLMMLLIVVDVLGRYLFGKPTLVAYELTGYALVAITFLALANTQRLGKHMVVTVVTGRLAPNRRKWLELLTNTISLAFLIWFTWTTAIAVLQSYELKSVSHGVINTPYWIPKLLLPIGLSLFALQLFAQLLRRVMFWRQELKIFEEVDTGEELAEKFVG